MPYLEAVEEALCFGWIDGVAKRIDSTRLAQRFTPRRRRSHGTELNKLRARRLLDEGRMTEEVRRKPQVFRSRLEHFLKKTRRNERFGGLR